VVTQRGRRKIDVRLNFACRCAVGPALHDETDDGEPRVVPQGAQLFGMEIELRRHQALFLLFSKQQAKTFFPLSRD
jgi:hypothetical protein